MALDFGVDNHFAFATINFLVFYLSLGFCPFLWTKSWRCGLPGITTSRLQLCKFHDDYDTDNNCESHSMISFPNSNDDGRKCKATCVFKGLFEATKGQRDNSISQGLWTLLVPCEVGGRTRSRSWSCPQSFSSPDHERQNQTKVGVIGDRGQIPLDLVVGSPTRLTRI